MPPSDSSHEPRRSQSTSEQVRRYYDHNTPRFLSYGAQRHTGTIHRAVWGPGVKDAPGALNYVNALLLADLEALGRELGLPYLRALDLGCGVGASLFYLAERFTRSFWGAGVTISPVQARLAHARSVQREISARCVFLDADFEVLPFTADFDAVFGIESFAHSSHPDEFFWSASRSLKPNGWLVICDDVLTPQGAAARANGDPWLDLFQWGWRVPSILLESDLLSLAAAAGFTLRRARDLTGGLRGRALPGWLVRLWARGLRARMEGSPYWRSVLGGQAQQHAYRCGWLSYRYLVFEKNR